RGWRSAGVGSWRSRRPKREPYSPARRIPAAWPAAAHPPVVRTDARGWQPSAVTCTSGRSRGNPGLRLATAPRETRRQTRSKDVQPMRKPYDALFRSLDRICQAEPARVKRVLEDPPGADDLPSPWSTWTLIGLCRHRERQLWVGEIVTNRLQGS